MHLRSCEGENSQDGGFCLSSHWQVPTYLHLKLLYHISIFFKFVCLFWSGQSGIEHKSVRVPNYTFQNLQCGKCFTYVTKTIAILTTYRRKPGDYNGTIIFEIDIMKNSSPHNLKFTFFATIKTKITLLFCWTHSTLSSASKCDRVNQNKRNNQKICEKVKFDKDLNWLGTSFSWYQSQK